MFVLSGCQWKTDTSKATSLGPASDPAYIIDCKHNNPLHLDDEYMKGSFGKTHFGGVIMHGMNNFGLISRMITDWAYGADAVHRRLETRWIKPVRPGDTIQPIGTIRSKQATISAR